MLLHVCCCMGRDFPCKFVQSRGTLYNCVTSFRRFGVLQKWQCETRTKPGDEYNNAETIQPPKRTQSAWLGVKVYLFYLAAQTHLPYNWFLFMILGKIQISTKTLSFTWDSHETAAVADRWLEGAYECECETTCTDCVVLPSSSCSLQGDCAGTFPSCL